MSTYDINILVNGSRCKQYHHQGRIFIEAKDGSEYTIEIKNHTWRRILAACSVDGLNILDGKTARENGPGYVINGYSSNRYDGFRVSDSKVAKFVFGKKGNSYAASKEDGSEKNVGVIGVRLFEELIKPAPLDTYTTSDFYCGSMKGSSGDPMPEQPTIWCDCDYSLDRNDALGFGDTSNATKGSSTGVTRGLVGGLSNQVYASSVSPNTFDMGTQWGESKISKVTEVEFERGILALSMDIYYASRQSLIEIGVPISNEKQVNFPSSFEDSKYAKPPKNWKGY